MALTFDDLHMMTGYDFVPVAEKKAAGLWPSGNLAARHLVRLLKRGLNAAEIHSVRCARPGRRLAYQLQTALPYARVLELLGVPDDLAA